MSSFINKNSRKKSRENNDLQKTPNDIKQFPYVDRNPDVCDIIIMMKNTNEDRIRETLRGHIDRSYRMAGASNVLKWISNDRCIPHDIMLDLKRYGMVDAITVETTRIVEREETDRFIEEYKKNRANRSAEEIAEERYEMRAAFGPGETVVNILTGERTEI